MLLRIYIELLRMKSTSFQRRECFLFNNTKQQNYFFFNYGISGASDFLFLDDIQNLDEN